MLRPRILLLGLFVLALALTALVARPAAACSAFCFDTPDGPVFGANLDLRWGDGLIFVNRRGVAKTNYMLNSKGEPLRWVSRHGSVTFNLTGIELPWAGMNEAGLVISSMQLLATEFPPADERYPVSSATWVQYLLDTCTTIDEVIAAQDSLRLRGDKVHFLVADSGGNCAIVESLGGQMLVHTGDDLPVRALANGVYGDCLDYLKTGRKPRFNPGRSAERVAAADRWIGRYDPGSGITAGDWALKGLAEAVLVPKAWWKGLVGEPYTRWSVVYDLDRRQIRFRTVDHAPLRSLDLAKLDFACSAPVLMMDVNAEYEGPVEGRLQPYDSAWNHEVAADFLHRWGTTLDDMTIRELTEFLESYPCAP